MADEENFLERWSRKKAQAQCEAADAPDAPAAPNDEADGATPARTAADPTPAPPQGAAPKPAFDLASLPSLDSITAATDIRAFLGPGVPQELARAALRRAWSADPAIRDHVGLQENGWDFTDPTAMPGFGDLPKDYDIRKLVAQMFGETDHPAHATAAADPLQVAAASPQSAEIGEQSAMPAQPSDSQPGDEPSIRTALPSPIARTELAEASAHDQLVQRNSNVALQESRSEAQPDRPKIRRQHGRALPE